LVKNGCTKVEPAAWRVPAGALRSARCTGLGPRQRAPGGAVVVVAGADDELQAARRMPPATRPTAKRRFVIRGDPAAT